MPARGGAVADLGTDRGWDDLLLQLGDRDVMRILSKAGGRAATRARAVARKEFRRVAPRKSGEMARQTRAFGARRTGGGIVTWTVRLESKVPYWGPQIQRDVTQDAYEDASEAARDWWREKVDELIAEVFREELS